MNHSHIMISSSSRYDRRMDSRTRADVPFVGNRRKKQIKYASSSIDQYETKEHSKQRAT